jgi:heme/copper-type cytochrome/quinol oxidase subunit 2
MALASLILAILGFCGFNIVLFIPSILAIVLGAAARRQISASGGTLTGGGMAMAGIAIGAITLMVSCLGAIGYGALIATGSMSFGP